MNNSNISYIYSWNSSRSSNTINSVSSIQIGNDSKKVELHSFFSSLIVEWMCRARCCIHYIVWIINVSSDLYRSALFSIILLSKFKAFINFQQRQENAPPSIENDSKSSFKRVRVHVIVCIFLSMCDEHLDCPSKRLTLKRWLWEAISKQ